MRTIIISACIILLTGVWVFSQDAEKGKEEKEEKSKKVYYITVSDQKEFMVDTVLSTYIRNSLERAKDGDLVIMEIDTYGGLLKSADEIRESINDAIHKHGFTLVAFIPKKAVSAGAAIAVTCSEIVMQKGAHFGDCAPVMMTTEGPKMLNENDKTTSFLRKNFETSCKKNGYPYRIGHAMVSQNFATYVLYESAAVKIYSYEEFKKLPDEKRKKISGGDIPARTEFYFPEELSAVLSDTPAKKKKDKPEKPQIDIDIRTLKEPITVVIDEVFEVDGRKMCFLSESPEAKKDFVSLSEIEEEIVRRELSLKQIDSEKELVELSADEAYRYHFAKKVVSSKEELFDFYGIKESDVEAIEPSPAETAVRWLNHPLIAGLLIMIGIIAIYAELHTPGFGVAGATALICFALYFLIAFLAREPHLLPVILFLLGIVLLAIEIFVIPGFGIAGISGIILMILGLMTVRLPREIFTPGRTLEWRMETFSEPLMVVFGGFVLGLIGCIIITRFLPEIKWFSGHIVTGPARIESSTESGVSVSNVKTEVAEGDEAVVCTDLRPSGKIEIKGKRLIAVSNGDYINKGARVKVVKVRGNQIIVEEV
jgi:membrane-bound ClpP family serine protease